MNMTFKTEALNTLENRWPNDSTSGMKVVDSQVTSLTIDPADAEVVAKFAQDNGFSYQQGPTIIDTRSFTSGTPVWASGAFDHSVVVLHEAAGTLFGFDTRFQISYRWSGGSAGSDTVSYDYVRNSVVRIKLPKRFPQMLLDSHKNDMFIVSSVMSGVSSGQRISLEGDFDKYFDFYVPQGLHINALSVLAPNFMDTLKRTTTMFDVEFYGDEMILTTDSPIYTKEVVDEMLEALKEQLKYLNRLLPSWNYEPVQAPFDVLRMSSTTGGDVLKFGKLRINTGYVVLVLVPIVVVLAMADQVMAGIAVFWAAAVVMFAPMTMRSYRRRKTKKRSNK